MRMSPRGTGVVAQPVTAIVRSVASAIPGAEFTFMAPRIPYDLRMRIHHIGVIASLLLAACLSQAAPASKPVDAARLRAADGEPGQWLMDGRNYSAQRYSTLKTINEGNVNQLGLAW